MSSLPRRSLSSVLAAVLFGTFSVTAPGSAPPVSAATPPVLKDRWAQEASAAVARGPATLLAAPVELELLELTNVDRASNGLEPLELDPAMLAIARARAAAQPIDGPLSHVDLAGSPAVLDLLTDAGIEYQLAGENLARAQRSDRPTLQRVQQAFLSSPAHRQNVLEPSFNRVAIGAATDPSGRVVLAAVFRAAP